MTFHDTNRLLQKTYLQVKHLHTEKGHHYIRTHWNRYVNLLMLMPQLSGSSRILEIGASILSAHLRIVYNCKTTIIHHELEPEWKSRCDLLGIESFPIELMRDPLPVPNNSFDLILFNEVFEHFPLNPSFFLYQALQKLSNEGEFFFSVPNFATSEKRLQLFVGQNPQDMMDEHYVYYAHHREPVMNECCRLINDCGGHIIYRKWLELDDNPECIPSLKRHLFHLYRKRFHPLLHQIFPTMRKYIVIKAQKNDCFAFNCTLGTPPLSLSNEFRR